MHYNQKSFPLVRIAKWPSISQRSHFGLVSFPVLDLPRDGTGVADYRREERCAHFMWALLLLFPLSYSNEHKKYLYYTFCVRRRRRDCGGPNVNNPKIGFHKQAINMILFVVGALHVQCARVCVSQISARAVCMPTTVLIWLCCLPINRSLDSILIRQAKPENALK